MAGRTLRGALLIGALVVAAAACTPLDDGGSTTSTTSTTTVEQHDEWKAGCKTERSAVRTAYAAAEVARMVGGNDTVFDYLSPGTFGTWFQLESPTTGPVLRIAGTVDRASEADCPSLSLAEVPIGSY